MKSPAHVRSRGFSASVAVLAAPLSGVPRAFGGQLTTSLAGRVGEAAKVVRRPAPSGVSGKVWGQSRLLMDLWTPSWTRLDAACGTQLYFLL